MEIRKGLRKLDFSANGSTVANDRGTHVTVEFEIGNRLAKDQIVSINLGLHNGTARELRGLPVLIKEPAAKQSAYLYRLEGDVA